MDKIRKLKKFSGKVITMGFLYYGLFSAILYIGDFIKSSTNLIKRLFK